jgi:uncharacterized membrane protein
MLLRQERDTPSLQRASTVVFVRALKRIEATLHGNAPCTFLGRSLLLGLEFLVAGDIIKTVAIEPTRDRVVVLVVIVLVRTVLSLSIDVEIDGRWPWQAAEQEALARAAQVRDVASVETGTRTGRGGARDR